MSTATFQTPVTPDSSNETGDSQAGSQAAVDPPGPGVHLTLLGHPLSAHARKVHFALEEIGMPHTYQFVDLGRGEQKQPGFIAVNPIGKVPVLVEKSADGEFALRESGAILWYLANNYGHGKLIPKGGVQGPYRHLCARIDQWMFWLYSESARVLAEPWILRLHALLEQKQVDEGRLAELKAATAPHLKILDEALANNDYIVGNTLTLVDIAVYEHVWQAVDIDIDIRSYPNVSRWFAAISARPACQKTRPQK